MALCSCVTLLVENLLLLAAFGASLTVAITVTLLMRDFDGDCPLFPTIPSAADRFFFTFEANDVSNCKFVMALNYVTAGMAVLAMVLLTIRFIRKTVVPKKSLMPLVALSFFAITGLLVAASAIVVSLGFKRLCDGLVNSGFFSSWSCEGWQDYLSWDSMDYNGSHFYDYLFITQIAVWLNAGLWIALAVVMAVAWRCFSQMDSDDDIRGLVN
ncbi:transmembrane protein 179B-like [Diadema setosum]|uniref:transmembrane protein 179B-like n=1 Tax=Diadema setosum TaxID=31175 RepID=UPI003B3AEF7B